MNKEDRHSPSHFLAVFCPKPRSSDSDHSYDDFVTTAKVKPDISIATRSFTVHLVCSPSTQIELDHKNQVTLILHGEIYNTKYNQAEFLVEQFIEQGLTFSKDINGSFAVLLIDKRNDTVALITDRINTRKVFYSKYKGGCWLSSSLYIHPIADVDLDPVGVAWYLANGVVHNNRTLFDGIRVLERACVHELTQDGFHATRYWSYEFAKLYSDVDENRLRAQLSELLVESVKVRLDGNSKVFLSLSGGYDATGVLGILGSELGIPNVDCFSYALGIPKPSSDEYVSREMATCLGYDHRIIRSYKGKLLDVIKHNANLGHGLANFCEEVDAWLELAKDFSSSASNVLFVADVCFGERVYSELNSNTDVLNSVWIYDFTVLSWLRHMLPKGMYDILHDGLKKDISQILRRCPPNKDYHDNREFLFLDQRLNNVILPWRDFFSGQFITVRNPFLDNAILDFVMNIPGSLRCRKHLYKETITQMFPDLFQFQRATTASYKPNWKQEFNSQLTAIEPLISSRNSQLDTIVSPDVILKLLRLDKTFEHGGSSTKTIALNVARRLFGGTSIARKTLSLFPGISRKEIDPTTFLIRVLIVRLFLSKIKSKT